MQPRGLILAAVLLLAPFSGARAESLDVREIPADAKWIMHVDVDAMQASKLGGMLKQRIAQDTRAQAGINEMQIVWGMKFPQDLHGITLYGRDYVPDTGVAVAHVAMDQAKIINLLKLNAAYSSSTYGTYEIHSWQDKGNPAPASQPQAAPEAPEAATAPAPAEIKPRQMYGAFHGATVIVVSQSQKDVKAALDLLDGKSVALKTEAPLLAGAKKGDMAYVAGAGLTALKGEKLAQTPMLEQADSGWMSCREQDGNLVLHVAVVATDAQAAQEMQASLEGIRAMINLANHGGSTATTQDAEPVDPKTKLASDALQKLTVTLADKTLSLDLPISLDLIRAAMESMREQGPAATAPATAPAGQ